MPLLVKKEWNKRFNGGVSLRGKLCRIRNGVMKFHVFFEVSGHSIPTFEILSPPLHTLRPNGNAGLTPTLNRFRAWCYSACQAKPNQKLRPHKHARYRMHVSIAGAHDMGLGEDFRHMTWDLFPKAPAKDFSQRTTAKFIYTTSPTYSPHHCVGFLFLALHPASAFFSSSFSSAASSSPLPHHHTISQKRISHLISHLTQTHITHNFTSPNFISHNSSPAHFLI